MAYVDGFVIPVPKKNLKAYMAMARKASKIWKEHGALEYRECAGDDLAIKGMAPFTKLFPVKPGETLVFSYVVFKSRAHRDKANAKIMQDPRVQKMCDPKNPPFDFKRMAYGGFKSMVSA